MRFVVDKVIPVGMVYLLICQSHFHKGSIYNSFSSVCCTPAADTLSQGGSVSIFRASSVILHII
jgi:hypothetical protein